VSLKNGDVDWNADCLRVASYDDKVSDRSRSDARTQGMLQTGGRMSHEKGVSLHRLIVEVTLAIDSRRRWI
jgi:hypothetical protein